MIDLPETFQALERVLHLAEELCEAVDMEAEDIGTGPRNSLAILQELGPAVSMARAKLTEKSV